MAGSGRLPPSSDRLRELPGIGPYTAAAVASLAFGEAGGGVGRQRHEGGVPRDRLRRRSAEWRGPSGPHPLARPAGGGWPAGTGQRGTDGTGCDGLPAVEPGLRFLSAVTGLPGAGRGRPDAYPKPRPTRSSVRSTGWRPAVSTAEAGGWRGGWWTARSCVACGCRRSESWPRTRTRWRRPGP